MYCEEERQINSERWAELSRHLDELLDVDEELRAARLSRLRADNALLADELEQLLRQQAAADRAGFLVGSALGDSTFGAASIADQVVGSYTLERPLGEGGMGTVWLARRSDGRFEGKVAVKLLNLALPGRGGLQRFEREGSVLARLAHPNIARLLDAGVATGGQPYLVLEYVEGVVIDRYCDERRLHVHARIELFLYVLDAVAHAHSKLILHRDLKPLNVLVTAEGQVKLLDFGIAKLLDEETRLAHATALTEAEGRAFTPDYAAPEQVQGGDVTTATDVYSLGVLLYELLGGHHPTHGATTSKLDRLRAVIEKEPERLSDVARTTPSDGASHRGVTVQRLTRTLRGDLDNIVAKALKKAPAERYPSAAALAEELRRYLRDEPVEARPDSAGYRVGKFVRRYRLAVGAATATILALLVGVVGTTWQAWEAQRQRAEAQAQRDIALQPLERLHAFSEFLGFVLSEGGAQGKPVTVSVLLRRGELMLDRRFGADDAVRAELLLALSSEYYAVGDTDGALRTARRAVEVAKAVGDPGPVAHASCILGLHIGRESPAEGARLIDDSLQSLTGSDIEANYRRIDCLLSRSTHALTQGRGAAALADAQQARTLVEAGGFVPREQRFVIDERIAYAHSLMGELRQATTAYAALMDELQRFGLAETTLGALLLNNSALVQIRGGDMLRAVTLLERAAELERLIDPERPASPVKLINLANVNLELGRAELAGRQIEAAIDRLTRAGNPRLLGEAQLLAGAVQLERADLRGASRFLSAAEATLAPQFSADHPLRLRVRLTQAMALRLAGERAAAAEAMGPLRIAVSARKSPTALHVRVFAEGARQRIDSGDLAGAQADANDALDAARAIPFDAARSLYVGMAQTVVGEAALATGRRDEARAALQAALASLQQSVGADHVRAARVSELLARSRL
ncbi:MAG: serine/threonine-protein kinase [Burkholderiaceae bacterium]